MLRDLINRPSGPREINQDTIVVPDLTDSFVEAVKSIQRISFEPNFSKIYTYAATDIDKTIELLRTMKAAVIKERIKMNDESRRR